MCNHNAYFCSAIVSVCSKDQDNADRWLAKRARTAGGAVVSACSTDLIVQQPGTDVHASLVLSDLA